MVLGWSDRLTTVIMGVLVVSYTATGGIKAVTWADVQQMVMIMIALVLACLSAIHLLPGDVSFADAVWLAGAAGRLNAVDLHFDLNNRYNVWSGLIGGMFLALAYFGCDQSQVQRYLTGKSIAQSRLSLIFTAMAKIPMQFFILFIGAMVFVLNLFVQPPLLFQQPAMASMRRNRQNGRRLKRSIEARLKDGARPCTSCCIGSRRRSVRRRSGRAGGISCARRSSTACAQGLGCGSAAGDEKEFNDTNYIFLSFVTTYLPVGIVGLVIGVIFSASMSSTSGEINSLATVTVIDIYRQFSRNASDQHYLMASRVGPSSGESMPWRSRVRAGLGL